MLIYVDEMNVDLKGTTPQAHSGLLLVSFWRGLLPPVQTRSRHACVLKAVCENRLASFESTSVPKGSFGLWEIHQLFSFSW